MQWTFAYRQTHKVAMGIGQAVAIADLHVEAIDLLGNRIAREPGIALLLAGYAALTKHSTIAALLVLGA